MNPNPNSLPMINPAEVTLSVHASVRQAMTILNGVTARIVLVVDAEGRLAGSVVDGDIRRGMLGGATLETPVENVMHRDPYVLPVTTPRSKLLEAMRTLDIKQIPLVTGDGKLAGVVVYDTLAGLQRQARGNEVVIMAGGKGRRLLPITSDVPKPMVPVGGKPILEWIIMRLTHYGFHNFSIAVNYLGHMIEDYFGDGHTFDCRISYIREKEFMGTAGALSLLDKKLTEPFMVINGDILTSIDFEELLAFHERGKAAATVCARSHQVEVPYGVIQQEDGLLKGIVEKPVYDNLISAGMYVLSPEALRYVPGNGVTDMPSLLLSLVQDRKKVSVFSMQDEWVDIGRHDDLDRAQRLASGAK